MVTIPGYRADPSISQGGSNHCQSFTVSFHCAALKQSIHYKKQFGLTAGCSWMAVNLPQKQFRTQGKVTLLQSEQSLLLALRFQSLYEESLTLNTQCFQL